MTKDNVLSRNYLDKDIFLIYRKKIDHILRQNMTFEQSLDYLKETMDEEERRKIYEIIFETYDM